MAFEKIKKLLGRKKTLPEGLWQKCRECGKMIYNKELEERKKVCTECGYHFTLTHPDRIGLMLDEGSFQEMWGDLESNDPLNFKGVTSYREKYEKARKETGLNDACITGKGRLKGRDVFFGMTTSKFMMGSMGSVVGEKVTRCFEYATENKLPVVFVSGSGGGARMYEGALSLMQMAKTSSAVGRFSDRGGLFISILTNPMII